MHPSIQAAKDLLNTIHIATMATVNADGSPHNTPYFFARSPDLTKIYWRSRPDTLHSQNIARTGQLFVVLYEAVGNGQGLYITAVEGRVAEGTELDNAVVAFNAARQKAGRMPFSRDVYAQSAPHLYVATVQALWVNGAEEDKNGLITRDYRHQITRQDLL